MNRHVAALAGLSLLALAGGASSASAVDLTMWKDGDCPPESCIEQALIDSFEAANPDIKVELITQPPDGYFTSLLAASVISRGPDLAAMWAGQYMNEFEPYMLDLHPYVADDIIASTNGAQFFSKDNDASKAFYAVPMSSQWYTGFYNKKLFADAGITKVPTTWTELHDAAEALKAKGIQPLVVGANPGSAQFQPLYEWSYIAAAVPLSDWGKLLDGTIPYNDPRIVAQLDKWNGLYKDGLINQDAFNYPGAQDDFKAGKAAIFLAGGSWQISSFGQALGDDLGIIIPPYSDTPQTSLVALAGSGYAVMNYSPNKEAAAKFAAYILSDEGQKIVAKYDAPPRAGFPTTLPQMNELITMSAQPGVTIFPMFDNFTNPAVADAIYRNAALVLVGQASAADALSAIDGATAALPPDQKNVHFSFAGK